MAVTVARPDDLIQRLRERGIRDSEAMNQYAVAAVSAYFDDGSDAATMPASPAPREPR